MSPPEKPKNSRTKGRFVWLWHPHFWLTALIVIVVVILMVKYAK